MTMGGWILLIGFWGTIVLMAGFCFIRILSKPGGKPDCGRNNNGDEEK